MHRMTPNWTQRIRNKKSTLHVHMDLLGLRFPNFHLFCSTISCFQDIAHFRIFTLTPMLNFQSATNMLSFGHLGVHSFHFYQNWAIVRKRVIIEQNGWKFGPCKWILLTFKISVILGSFGARFQNWSISHIQLPVEQNEQKLRPWVCV